MKVWNVILRKRLKNDNLRPKDKARPVLDLISQIQSLARPLVVTDAWFNKYNGWFTLTSPGALVIREVRVRQGVRTATDLTQQELH